MTHPLWAPWRMDYILGPKPDSCVLCLPPDDLSHDEERLVLYRGKTAFVIMNKFPYNNGHIMVAPLRHVMDLPLLAAEESTEIMELLKQCTTSFMAVMSETRVIPDHLASTYTKLKPLFARLRPGQPA